MDSDKKLAVSNYYSLLMPNIKHTKERGNNMSKQVADKFVEALRSLEDSRDLEAIVGLSE